jgi:hypothetical protein
LNEIVIVIIRVGGGVAGIAKLHLKGEANRGVGRREIRKQKQTGSDYQPEWRRLGDSGCFQKIDLLG